MKLFEEEWINRKQSGDNNKIANAPEVCCPAIILVKNKTMQRCQMEWIRFKKDSFVYLLLVREKKHLKWSSIWKNDKKEKRARREMIWVFLWKFQQQTNFVIIQRMSSNYYKRLKAKSMAVEGFAELIRAEVSSLLWRCRSDDAEWWWLLAACLFLDESPFEFPSVV